jgi:hypothetical protein
MDPSQHAARRQRVLECADSTDAYGFFNLLTGPQLLDQVEALLPEHREGVFPPTETLAMFLAQALSAGGSCRRAVNDAAVKRLIAGLTPHGSRTSAYCQARSRLPLSMIESLTRQTGGIVAEGAAPWWLWRNRRVRLVDGATMTLADTPENQAKYPQPKSQKTGLGFPLCRMGALLCLATGGLLDTLHRGEILVADAYYATYFLLCERVRRGVDGVFEQYGARKRSTEFRVGKSLGVRDHRIVLTRPKRPQWLEQDDYDQAPATLTVREFQAGGKIMVTTFLCPKETPKALLKTLYRSRQNIERDLRNLKTTLGMEPLRCKTPEMAAKELWVYLLAYNLIRLLMAQAALLADQIPRQLSFKHTVQVWASWQQRGGGTHEAVCIRALLVLIAAPRVGLRPGRIEPRALKRRLKNCPLLTKPRALAQEEVRTNGHPRKQR